MKNFYILPLEIVKGRYTEQWYRNIPIKFKQFFPSTNIEIIDGDQLTDHVDVGTFLDIHTTIYYKNSQLQKVAKLFMDKKVQNGDVFFLYDVEFWGAPESIRLLAQMNKLNVKIFGFLHAASHTKQDAFSVAHKHQKYTELGWVAACDKIFVGSEYSKRSFIERRIIPYAAKDEVDELSKKIVVTYNPIFPEDYDSARDAAKNKKFQLILPNRFDWEKRPNLSLDFAYLAKKKWPDLTILVTTSHPKFKSNKKWLEDYARNMEKDGIIQIREGLTKHEYHTLLAESKVMLSNSIEENFGICIAESIEYNTFPLLKNDLSHPELVEYDSDFLFDDEDQILDKMEKLLFHETKVIRHYNIKCYNAINKRAKESKNTF